MINDWFYKNLREIYEISNKYIHKSTVNPCRNCLRCCSVEARLGIRLIEYDYIERYLKEEGSSLTSSPFKDYINKKRNKKGGFIHNICPYYDLKNRRCDIYPARTMSCRLFPYYTTKKDVFFDNCPLNSKAVFLTPENIIKELPFLERYYFLCNEYDKHIISKYKPF